MKWYLPYIMIMALVLSVAVLLIKSGDRPRQFDERITLKPKDKIPYGMSAAKTLLTKLYPKAKLTGSAHPTWMHNEDSQVTIIIIADRFDADEDEMLSLLSFLSNGNTVFVAARSFSADVKKYLGFMQPFYLPGESQAKGLSVRLNKTFFEDDSIYSYPGFSFTQALTAFDDSLARVLGTDAQGQPNFFQFQKGRGSLFVHLSPLVFSNYFVLHKNNAYYLESLFSVFSAPKKIEWNETFLQPPSTKAEDKGWLNGLLKFESFRWSFGVAIIALFLFILLGMRRQQRLIPVYAKPVNDSFEFIKTLGRLYFEKGDHQDLANKMAIYFQEHIRSQYKIITPLNEEAFIKILHLKTGYPEDLLQKIVGFMNDLPHRRGISETELGAFYQQLALFYQKTATWQKNFLKQEGI